jgi:nitrate/TMAO reductase-like tetraheme cytochrome c subunit
MSSRLKIVLFFVILLFPAVLGFATAKVSFSRAERVDFCGSCHTMQPWIDDVTGSESASVAGAHFANRWIQRDQCYSCHSNYSFLGPMKAKIRGVEHVVAFYVGHSGPISLYDEFPNANCLQCHEQAKGFREESAHDPIEDLLAGKESCVECHDLHDVEQDEPGDDSEQQDSADDSEKQEPADDSEQQEPGDDSEQQEPGDDSEQQEPGDDSEKEQPGDEPEPAQPAAAGKAPAGDAAGKE